MNHDLFSNKHSNKLKIVLAVLLIGGIVFQTVTSINAAAFGTPTSTPVPVFPVLTAREFHVPIYAESVAFSPDGRYVLAGSADGTVTLWNAATGDSLRTFSGERGIVWRVAFSPDGKEILMVGGHTVQVWKTSGTHLATLRGHTQIVLDAAFSPDGKYVVAVGGDATAILWNAASGQHIRTFSNPVVTPHRAGVTGTMMSVTFSPDGKYILTGSDDGAARLWEVNTGLLIQTVTATDAVRSVAFSPDGKSILTGSFNNTAQLWDISTGTSVRTFSGHTGKVFSAVFSPDGRYILTGSQDHTAILWDTATGAILQTFRRPRGQVDSVAFSPDGKYILTGSEDGTARLFVIDTAASTRPISVVTTAPTESDLQRYHSINEGAFFADTTRPGTEYVAVTVKANETRVWGNGWCRNDMATARADWKLITQRFLINGTAVPVSQLLDDESTRSDGLTCMGQSTLLSGWRPGESYTLTTEQTFNAAIKDGKTVYPAGKYAYVIYVTVQ